MSRSRPDSPDSSRDGRHAADESEPHAASLAQGLVARLRRLEQRSPRVERVLTIVALVTFAGAAAYAFANFPETDEPFRWSFIVLAGVVAVPATLVVNSVEFQLSGRLVDQRIPLPEALRVTVLSSAANMLPIPGAVVVRTRALRQLGSGFRGALSALAAIGLTWVGTAGLLSGTLLAFNDRWALGGSFLVGSLMVTGLAFALLVNHAGRTGAARWMPRILVVELASTGLAGVRMLLVLRGIGVDAGWAQAFAFALVAIVASASGLFPGGLGLREVLSGALSPLIGLAATVGLAVSAVERIILFVALAALAGGLLLAGAERSVEPESEPIPPEEDTHDEGR